MKNKIVFVVLTAAGLSGCGAAKLSFYRAFGPDHHYAAAAGPVAALPPPPAPGSPEDKRDFQVLLDWQARRTEADCAAAREQAAADYDRFFGDISPFPAPLPRDASAILFRVYYDGSAASEKAKERFRRQRPFRRDEALKPCLGRVGGLSYPSGHATVSRLVALVLADADPAGREVYLARGDRAALNRVIGGVHHPSDIEAGKLLAGSLHAALLESRAYRADLEKLRRLVKPR